MGQSGWDRRMVLIRARMVLPVVRISSMSRKGVAAVGAAVEVGVVGGIGIVARW
jgi:hypothetical protein